MLKVLHLREAQLNSDLPGNKSVQEAINKNIRSLRNHAEIIRPNITNQAELKLVSSSEFLQMLENDKPSKQSRLIEEEELPLESRLVNEAEEPLENLSATQKLKSEYLKLKNAKALGSSVEKYKEVEQISKNAQFNAEMLVFVDVCSRSDQLVNDLISGES